MRSLHVLLVLAAALVVAAACTPAAQPQAPAPKAGAPPPAKAEQKPAAPAPQSAKPASPAKQEEKPAAKADWEIDWEQTLEAARREGKVTVAIPTGDRVRQVLTLPFEEKYGIQVDAYAARGAELAARIMTERGAGQHLTDVYVGGTTQVWSVFLPEGVFDPIEPALILPEVTDPANWRGGEIEYLDDDRLNIVMTPFLRGCLFVNPNVVDPASFTTWHDLLDPQWKGQIILDDPRRPGPGNATFTMFYLHPELGPDYVRALAEQEPIIMSDYVQEVDAIGQGRFPILIGTSDNIAEERMHQGVPIHIVDPTQMREMCDVSPANGSVSLLGDPLNPNAAKVYINWLLTQETQQAFAEATGYVSARVDVPTDHALPWRVPVEGAIKSYGKHAADVRDDVVALATEVLAGR